MTGMNPAGAPRIHRRKGPDADPLQWTRMGDDLAAGRYRVRMLGSGEWESKYRGRILCVDTRRSVALAGAQQHNREVQRRQQVMWWGSLAGIWLLAAVVLSHWLADPVGFFLFAIAAGSFLGSMARCQAAGNRSLLDPYRARESWESPDWWSRNQ